MHFEHPGWISLSFAAVTIGVFAGLVVVFKVSLRLTLAVAAWAGVLAALALNGFFLDFSAVPPRMALAVVPGLASLAIFACSKDVGRRLAGVPLQRVYYFQSFRVLIEGMLWALFHYGALPKVMTFEGRNFDILVGLSAPLVGYLVHVRGVVSRKVAIVWNICGIIILSVTVFHGLFSAPTPFRIFFHETSTAVIGTFPFIWLPALAVPFAFLLHILAIRGELSGAQTRP